MREISEGKREGRVEGGRKGELGEIRKGRGREESREWERRGLARGERVWWREMDSLGS